MNSNNNAHTLKAPFNFNFIDSHSVGCKSLTSFSQRTKYKFKYFYMLSISRFVLWDIFLWLASSRLQTELYIHNYISWQILQDVLGRWTPLNHDLDCPVWQPLQWGLFASATAVAWLVGGWAFDLIMPGKIFMCGSRVVLLSFSKKRHGKV